MADWPNSNWLLEHTRFGKGSPLRAVGVEGYGYTSEQLANVIGFTRELLVRLDANLRAGTGELAVRDFL